MIQNAELRTNLQIAITDRIKAVANARIAGINQVTRQKLAALFSQRRTQAVVGHAPCGSIPPSWKIGNDIILKDTEQCSEGLLLAQSKEKCNTGTYITSWNTVEITEPLRYEHNAITGIFRSIRVRDIIAEQNIERFGSWVKSGYSLLPISWTNMNKPPPSLTIVAMICTDFGALLVALTLCIATTILTTQQTKLNQETCQNDINLAGEQHQQDIYLANQEEKERILTTYLHDRSTLLLNNYTTPDKCNLTSNIIRAKALTTLIQLDAQRKRQILLFLYDTKFIMRNNERLSINLYDAELDSVGMSFPRTKQRLYTTYEAVEIQFRGAFLVNSLFTWHRLSFSNMQNG
ncbi:unnamed protein product [Rotaria sp. Silwood2]|nr:unnamed protein product [Rotaria sp. Silwood2]CAF3373753.1 unnamed protein product [Rotaria sp. Silwood2]CAF4402985.1 unnamed protein product [Rotaria sp. Silwood2]CAF4409160.1 unnamed protein product [Rotaria sp. Silwood2]